MFRMKHLNQEQQEAVAHTEGPLLVLAGAGSGKTRVVTERIIHLIENGVYPSQILGLTFTNKAAGEMKERIHRQIQARVWISTFHSLGARVLRESIMHLGFHSDFIIYDEEDSEKLLRTCFNELQLKEKRGEFKAVRHLISTVKNNLSDPEFADTSSLALHLQGLFPSLYSLYERKSKESNAVDFDDLLFLPVKLFQEFPEILEHYQSRWRYLLIDEYQDTNHAQYEMVKQLVAKSRNLFVVGDPDQSIYSWRGADIHNILNFEKDYHGAKIIRLEQNYRSRSNILEAANQLISHNEERYEKNLWSQLGEGAKIRRFSAYDDREEASFVVRKMRAHHENQGMPFKQMVVFYRTNAQSRAFEDQLLFLRIPYVIVGGISFYQRKEIKDILGFLRLAHSSADTVAFSRMIHIPKRGVGETTVEKLTSAASAEGMPLLNYCRALVNGASLLNPIKLASKAYAGVEEFVSTLEELKKVASNGSLKDLVVAAIEITDYLRYLKEEDLESFEDRKENLDELIAKAVEWEQAAEEPSLAGFLEELSLKSSLDEAEGERDRVNLMTIHNGKGLEFETTFIVGLEEELFPHINAQDKAAIEEERRLCYVGMTRAKEYLYLTHSRVRTIWGSQRLQRPSRFLQEIPAEYIEKVSY